MKATIVYDNEAKKQGLKADWGFACLVEIGNMPPILFDTGGDGVSLLHNMRELGINPGDIATVVISHAHGDHTGGLWDIQAVNSNGRIVLGPYYCLKGGLSPPTGSRFYL